MAAARSEVIGRDAELEALSRFVSSVAEGPSGLLISGEPGIGKTTIWLDGVAASVDAGYRVLTSRPVESEAKMSFTTLGDLLGDVVDSVAEALPEPQHRALDAALLRGNGTMRPDRRAVSLATSTALRSLADPAPVLIAIDDVQWIDTASAKVLSFAVRRLQGGSVGVLATLRAEHDSRDLLDLERAFAGSAFSRIDVGSLDVMLVSRLLRDRLGAEFPHTVVAQVHAACGGNPFFALEIGRGLLRRGSPPRPGEPVPIPDDLGGLLRSRLRALTHGSREALLVTAAAARPSVDLVGAAVSHPDHAKEDLAAASDAGVVEFVGEVVRFTHPLLASTVYASASPDERRSAHSRLATKVPDDEERARHLALAASAPDEDVAATLDEAASKAMARGASDSGAELQDLAVRLTPSSDEAAIRSRSIRAAQFRYTAGDGRTAIESLERLIAVTPSGPDRASVRSKLSQMLWNDIGRIRGLLALAAEEAGDDAPASLRMNIEGDLGWVGQMGGDLAVGSRHGRHALALAEEIGDPDLVAEALTGIGYDEFLLGRPTKAFLERAVSLEEGSERRIVSYTNARRVLGATAMWAGELDDARTELERDHRETIQLGALSQQWESLVFLAELELRSGNWDRAERYAAEGLESTVESGLEEAREVHLWSTALVAAHKGDVDPARANAGEGLRIAEAHGDVFHVVTNRSVLGFLELSLGDPEAAHAWMGPLIEITDRWSLAEPGAFPFMPDEIEALIELGELSAAETLLERLESQGRALDRALALATSSRCRALLAASAGDLPCAERSIREALQHHERLPQPLDRGRTLLAAGRIQRRFKKKAPARAFLEEALELFDALGARLWSARAREELGRVGGRPPSPTDLTETERRVAEIVAEGKTNAETAALLFMSVHTVRSNLRRIYGKLGVRSRSELARRLDDST